MSNISLKLDDNTSGIPENRDRLFLASCIALIVTAMTFAIRAGILNELSGAFALDNVQLGWVNSMAFLGFPVAMLIGGLIYNAIGPKVMMWIAFISHVLGLVLTITAGGFWGLMISTFFIGFANGSVEAACNPMIADMYPDKKTEMLNKFHVWFPGGIVIGSLVARFMGGEGFGLSWQGLIGIMFIPTILYGALIIGQQFPRSENIESDTSNNIKALLNPMFVFIAACMTLTAATEFSTTQWVEKILGGSGANPLLVLALVSGVMALGRFFGGPFIHKLSTVGVLWASAILSAVGVYLLANLSGGAVYFAAIIFALGICFFWPNMIAITSQYTPKTGALGMSLIGGAGMFSMVIWNPIIGGWLNEASTTKDVVVAAINANGGDANADTDRIYNLALQSQTLKQETEASGDIIKATSIPGFIAVAAAESAKLTAPSGENQAQAEQKATMAAEVVAGKSVLSTMNVFPLILIVLFGILFFWTRNTETEESH